MVFTLWDPLRVALKLIYIFAGLVLLRALSWLFNLFVLLPLFDPLRKLPGPVGSYSQTHFNELMDPHLSPETHGAWVKKYGHTFRFHGFGRYDYRLLSLDFRVVSHVLTSPIYEKPWQTRNILARLIGRGIFSMEGQAHRMQRKIIAPAFSGQSIKHMSQVMFQKADEMCARWSDIISESKVGGMQPQEDPSLSRINVTHWISRASFDVIGIAGFDYYFNALREETEPVYMAYRRMFAVADTGVTLRGLLDLYIPWLRKVYPGKDNKVIDESLKIINTAGRALIENKKKDILFDSQCEEGAKDLLSLLIKSNMSSDPTKRLTDQELLEQCSTFLLAGSDSVSTAISWCLYFLSQNIRIQDRLREELGRLPGVSIHSQNTLRPPLPSSTMQNPTVHQLKGGWDAVKSLSFLDAVVRETLRLCPPVHETIRVAMMDDQIPISRPMELRDGTLLKEGDHFTIRKGSYIHIPVEGLNSAEDIWGSDAQKFNPDRWFNLPQVTRAPAYPGLGSSMTFSFGPHSCLGYKFTVAEMKVFISTLIINFIFTPLPDTEIRKHNSILTRPFIKDKFEHGIQLPLCVRRVGKGH